MNERLRNQGRLAELKDKSRKLELRLCSLRDSIRANLDRFEPVSGLKLELVVEHAIEARSLQIEYLEAEKQKEALQEALGIV